MKIPAAVITADIVNSTKLPASREKALIAQLKGILKPFKSEFFRGDSFQAYLQEAADALDLALLCRTAAIAFSDEEVQADLRLSIGIGSVMKSVRSLALAKGEAFLLSGRSFDEMPKDGRRISITISNPMAQAALEILCDYLDSIYRSMSWKQAEVISELLSGKTQQEVAVSLGRSKSTIHQHVTAGRFAEIDKLRLQYRSIIAKLEGSNLQDASAAIKD